MISTFLTIMRRNNIKYRSFTILFFFSSIIWAVVMVLENQMRGSISEAAYLHDNNAIIRLLGVLTIIFAVRAVNAFIRTFLRTRFDARAGYSLRQNFLKYFLRIPFTAFEKAGSGESLSLFQNDLRMTRQYVGFAIWDFMEDILYLIAIFAFMFQINVVITFVLIGTIPLLAALQMLSSIPIQSRQTKMSDERANFNAVVNDSLQNISTIAAYSLEDILEERYLTAYDKYFDAFRKFFLVLMPLLSFGFVGALIPLSLVNYMAGSRVLRGYMSISEFIAYTSIALMTVMWVGSLAERFNHLQTGLANSRRLLKATSEELENLNSGDIADLTAPTIAFNNVSFRYNEDSPLAVDGVSFEINPGDRIAFVGGSGSGKSTILKLLLGLYEPTAGEINLSSICSTKLSKSSQRDVFAYVPQDSFLFPESIGENISAEKNPDQTRLEKAASDAGIIDFINSLPDKFDGELQEASENVSGGQRQRIAIARAFYKNAPIILFDEATSALDPTTEAAVLENFAHAAQDKTVVMVAHRPSAIAMCNRIIVMDEGKICGIGTHEELLQSSPTYKNLYQSREVAHHA